MWRLWNKLFGWDYIQWSNTAGQGIARVFVAYCGRAVYWRYKSIGVLDEIKDANQVYWLTCPPEKYLR